MEILLKNRDFIEKNQYRQVEDVALELANAHHPDAAFILRQIEGRQRLREKVPTWAAVGELLYPVRLSLEQCSGEPAARYKAQVVERLFAEDIVAHRSLSMVDLTGGFGVDFSFLASLFSRAVYVERQTELVALARHNFPLLGLVQVECVESDGIDYFRAMPPVDLLFLDPARRDGAGRKTVLIEDCQPDVKVLLPELLAKCRVLMLKLSTMLDLRQVIDALGGVVAEAHVFAAQGECKDLLLVCRSDFSDETAIFCANERANFFFRASDEIALPVSFADSVRGFLYEPDAAVMKAGAYKTIAVRYDLQKLHPNTHLYVSEVEHTDFPGRVFKIENVVGFSKKEQRELSALKRANLSVRNFPATVAELRKRLKLQEGGDAYLFACTLHDETKVIIIARKNVSRR